MQLQKSISLCDVRQYPELEVFHRVLEIEKKSTGVFTVRAGGGGTDSGFSFWYFSAAAKSNENVNLVDHLCVHGRVQNCLHLFILACKF
jgi:hypothetical protein